MQILKEILDSGHLKDLFESYSKSTNLTTAVLDLEGNVLLATNWQACCVKFHRENPETRSLCQESDTELASGNDTGNKFNLYRCKNGLIDVATPINIADNHVGNLFIGQFFLSDSRPDLNEFRKRAQTYNFDENSYLDSIKNVPIYTEEEIKRHMEFLCRVADMIGELGAKSIRISELKSELEYGFDRLGDFTNSMQKMVKIGGWEIDRSNSEIFWTKGVYDIYGIPYGTPINHQDGLKNFADYDRNRIERCVNECMENGTPYDEELDFFNQQGDKLVVRAVGKPIYDSNGTIIKLRGSFQDITEEKRQQLEHESNRLKMLRASKLATIGELAAGVAHEINNPLAIIAASISIITKENRTLEQKEKSALNIKKSVERISKIVTGLRKISGSRSSMNKTSIGIEEVVAEVVDLLKSKSVRHNVEIKTNLHSGMLLYADEVQIEQILINLVGNAIDATTGNKDAWVEISSDYDTQFTTITVKDSGSGIAPESVEQLFDPFFTTKAEGIGTGLGLSISQDIANEHGGKLNYQLIDGHTAFVVKIPNKQEVQKIA